MTHEKMTHKLMSKVKKTDSCWIWTGSKSDSGYGWITINHRRYLVHRLSYMLHIGEIPPKALICHTCDNPLCVNPDHLYVGSNMTNTEDKLKRNRLGKMGQKHLTPDTVRAIRYRHAEGETVCALADEYSISPRMIRYICAKHAWRDVE